MLFSLQIRLLAVPFTFLFVGLVATASAGIRTELIATGLSSPVFVTAPTGDTRLFILERAGRVRILKDGQLLPTPFLDMSADVATVDSFGMFGMAFAPDYATSGLFYMYATSPAGDSVITRYQVSANPDLANASSKQVMFQLAQTWTDHNGGTIAFHPLDGSMYFAPGDGGGGPNDPDETAQNKLNQLGKMLRFDVGDGTNTQFTAAADNPYLDDPNYDNFIWAMGLRNPFRFSFDRLTGELWMADVGQEGVEEIIVEPAQHAGGLNYGWDVMEGTLCNPLDPATSPPCNDPVFTPPLYEFDHSQGDCSVTGGYVYRGSIPEMQGKYFFSDYCSSRVWALERYPLTVIDRSVEVDPPGALTLNQVVGFGEDGYGELYIVSLSGQVYRFRSTDPDADDDVVPDSVDNCATVPNTGQLNFDGDSLGDACDPNDDNDPLADGADCRPLDATVWAIPAEASGLTATKTASPATTQWTWSAPSSSGTSSPLAFELLVAPTAGNFSSAACMELVDPSVAEALDTAAPPADSIWFYLGRAINPCGAGSGGFTSSGAPRTMGSCS